MKLPTVIVENMEETIFFVGNLVVSNDNIVVLVTGKEKYSEFSGIVISCSPFCHVSSSFNVSCYKQFHGKITLET